MTDPLTPGPVSPRDIADLLARATRLADAGPCADPREQVAYLAAKADLLARIVDQLDHDDAHHVEQVHHVAEHAARAADRAAARAAARAADRAAARLAATARAHRGKR